MHITVKLTASRLITLLVLFTLVSCSVLRGGRPSEPETVRQVHQTAPTVQAVSRIDGTTASPPSAENSGSMAILAEARPMASGNVAAQTAGSPKRGLTYRIQAGDTLWDIAIAHGVSLEDLLAANGIQDPDTIWAGQELVIPETDTAIVPAPEMPTEPTTTRQPLDEPQGGGRQGDFLQPPTLNNPTPAMDRQPLPAQVLLEPMLHDWQKMNNCAPTTVAMALSYYGRLLTQFDTAPALKGGPQDKNVSPVEIVAYLHDLGFGGIVRVNGDIETLQRLVSNKVPVIVEQWLDRPGHELTGHYRLVRGYDQTTQEIIVNDSYNGPRLRFSYAEFDRLWRPFNRAYIPVYQLDRTPVVRAVIGNDWDDGQMFQRAVETAIAEIDTRGDAYAWFNLGNSLLGLREYERAAAAFDEAIEIGLPPRMFWYQFGAFEAYNQAGQFRRVLDLSAPLTNLALEEIHYQRGVAHEGLGQRAAALVEYQRAAELNVRLTKAVEAAARLKGIDDG